MNTFSLFQEFDISVFSTDTWDYKPHKHSFFELIYILDGIGTHSINAGNYHFSKGDLFLLAPGDEHSFSIKEHTQFCLILFNKTYFSKGHFSNFERVNFSDFFNKIEFTLTNSNFLNKKLFEKKPEKKLVKGIINQIVTEFNQRSDFYEMIVQSNVLNLLCLVVREIRSNLPQPHAGNDYDKSAAEIMHYIQDNILDRDKLTIANLSAHFSASKNHLSAVFRSATGFSIKDYILNYKMNLIKHRLQYSSQTISEIAFELGFTDESHLNKLFRQRQNTTPRQYRIKNRN